MGCDWMTCSLVWTVTSLLIPPGWSISLTLVQSRWPGCGQFAQAVVGGWGWGGCTLRPPSRTPSSPCRVQQIVAAVSKSVTCCIKLISCCSDWLLEKREHFKLDLYIKNNQILSQSKTELKKQSALWAGSCVRLIFLVSPLCSWHQPGWMGT